MSGKSITIINSANVLARNFISNLRGYDRIICGDIYNNRTSFLSAIHQQRLQDPSVKIDHMNINSSLLLEQAIKPSHTVVYFTHDYLSMVSGKNAQHLETAEICNAYNVNKLLSVNPIEMINYYESDSLLSNPIQTESETHDKVLKEFKNTVIMRTNLVYGTNSYFVRFLQQNWLTSHMPFSTEKYNNYRFKPIHWNDLNDVLYNVLNDETESFNGKKLEIAGQDSFSYVDINNMIKQSFHRTSKHTSPNPTTKKLFMAWQLMFQGNNHIHNMENMLNFLNNRLPESNGYDNLLQSLRYVPNRSFASYYTKEQLEEKMKDLEIDKQIMYPELFRYWNNSLN